MRDFGKYFKKSDMKYAFLCPECGNIEERNYIPMNIFHCSSCNKSNNAEANIMANMFSLAGKPFRDIADAMCDRWAPKTAFIYDNYAVFECYTEEKLQEWRTYIDSHTLMFDGLDFQSDDKTLLLMVKPLGTVAEDAVVAG